MRNRWSYRIKCLFIFTLFASAAVGCSQSLPLAESDSFTDRVPQYALEDSMAALPEGELYITITADDVTLDAVLFDNQTARAFAAMLPLTVDLWHPAPDFARAFDLPERIPQYEEAGWDYELGSLAYWYEGPSVAVIYNASREETVVPVVPIGKITSDVSVFFEYEDTITIELKNEEGEIENDPAMKQAYENGKEVYLPVRPENETIQSAVSESPQSSASGNKMKTGSAEIKAFGTFSVTGSLDFFVP